MNSVIKWYNNARGYGFIEPSDDGDDIFFRANALDPALRPRCQPRRLNGAANHVRDRRALRRNRRNMGRAPCALVFAS